MLKSWEWMNWERETQLEKGEGRRKEVQRGPEGAPLGRRRLGKRPRVKGGGLGPGSQRGWEASAQVEREALR